MFRKQFVSYPLFDPITDLRMKVYNKCGVILGDKPIKKALNQKMTPDEVVKAIKELWQLLESVGKTDTFENYISYGHDI